MREKRCSSTVNIIIIAACFLLIGIFRTEAVFCVSEYTDESTQITFTYNIVNGCAVITGMNRETLPDDGTLTIPSEIDGKAVRVLGTSAFSNDKDIKKLIVPGSVHRIDHYCFNG